MISKSITTAI